MDGAAVATAAAISAAAQAAWAGAAPCALHEGGGAIAATPERPAERLAAPPALENCEDVTAAGRRKLRKNISAGPDVPPPAIEGV